MKGLHFGFIALVITWGSVAFGQQVPLVAQYPDMCDASAAVAVEKNLFIAASDEDNVLRVYRRDKAEQPQRIDLTLFLKLARGNPEVDTGRFSKSPRTGGLRGFCRPEIARWRGLERTRRISGF